jgi:hypothetical protein
MEDTDRRSGICTLRNQIEAARQLSGVLASQFERAPSITEKTRLARSYGQALKALHAMQYLLAVWERRERESA